MDSSWYLKKCLTAEGVGLNWLPIQGERSCRQSARRPKLLTEKLEVYAATMDTKGIGWKIRYTCRHDCIYKRFLQEPKSKWIAQKNGLESSQSSQVQSVQWFNDVQCGWGEVFATCPWSAFHWPSEPWSSGEWLDLSICRQFGEK
jgi:hypothetical protein